VKRKLHILFWLLVVTALVVFFVRRGQKDTAPSEAEQQPSSAVADPAPASAPLPPPKLAGPSAAPAASANPEVTAEDVFMKQIRDLVKSDPAKAVVLARAARQRFGDSHPSDERDNLLVQSYLNLQDTDAVRTEMHYYYEHHPHGRWGDYLFARTNVGPNSP
jgi:hypothetical protein